MVEVGGRRHWIETVFQYFVEDEGVSQLSAFVEELKAKGKKYETVVIAFMDAFSAVSKHSRLD